jgi:hypothetical protein
MRYRLDREMRGDWVTIFQSPAPRCPAEIGLRGMERERVRWVCRAPDRDETVEVWQWSDRVPLNPADIQCTDFVPGWKLLERKASPVPSADELGVLYMQGNI